MVSATPKNIRHVQHFVKRTQRLEVSEKDIGVFYYKKNQRGHIKCVMLFMWLHNIVSDLQPVSKIIQASVDTFKLHLTLRGLF